MKPPPFEYLAPDSLEAALEAKSQYGYDAALLAGGQSLVPAMNFRLAQPAVLIDLNGVPNLDTIQNHGKVGLRLGAMTRQNQLEFHPLVAEHAPLLQAAVPYIAHPQIRNRGTLGGSLAHADPAAELPVIALALEARVLARSPEGERWIQAEDFFLGLFTTDLEAEEILVEIEIPPMPARGGWAFQEFARRQGDYALAGVAALVWLDSSGLCAGARLVYLNVGETPMLAREASQSLVGQSPSAQLLKQAAQEAARKEIEPQGNVHATPAYQRHLAQVLTVRALEQAFQRAQARLESSPAGEAGP